MSHTELKRGEMRRACSHCCLSCALVMRYALQHWLPAAAAHIVCRRQTAVGAATAAGTAQWTDDRTQHAAGQTGGAVAGAGIGPLLL